MFAALIRDLKLSLASLQIVIIFSIQIIKKLVKIVDSDYLYWPFGSNANVSRNNDVNAGSISTAFPEKRLENVCKN